MTMTEKAAWETAFPTREQLLEMGRQNDARTIIRNNREAKTAMLNEFFDSLNEKPTAENSHQG